MVRHWKSLIDHICDIHEDCYHLELSDRPVKYICPGNIHHNVIYNIMSHAGSKAYEKLSDVVLNSRLMKDIAKLSPHHQTSTLESYHSVINHFAPKTVGIFTHWHLLQVRTYIHGFLIRHIINKFISGYYWQHYILMKTVTESKPRHEMG